MVKPLNDPENPRFKIMQAAVDLFALKGLEGVTTREIAKASGLNISLISYYFGGKEGLYKTAIQEFAHVMQENLDQVLSQFEKKEFTEKLFREQLDVLITNLIEMRLANPSIAKIFQREEVQGLPFARDVYESVFMKISVRLSEIIKKGQKKGLIKKNLKPEFLIWMIFHTVIGYFIAAECKTNFTEKCFSVPRQKKELKEHILMVLLEGVCK